MGHSEQADTEHPPCPRYILVDLLGTAHNREGPGSQSTRDQRVADPGLSSDCCVFVLTLLVDESWACDFDPRTLSAPEGTWWQKITDSDSTAGRKIGGKALRPTSSTLLTSGCRRGLHSTRESLICFFWVAPSDLGRVGTYGFDFFGFDFFGFGFSRFGGVSHSSINSRRNSLS